MDLKSEILIPFGNSSFGVTVCDCPKYNKICMGCTTCCVCRKSMNGRNRDYLAFQNNVSLYCHSECKKCLWCDTERDFSLNKEGAAIACECDYKCDKCNLPLSAGNPVCFTTPDRGQTVVGKHFRCMENEPRHSCKVCGTNFSTRKRPLEIIENISRHIDCIPKKCTICEQNIWYGTGISLMGYDYHNKCLCDQNCTRCGEKLDLFGKYIIETDRGKSFHHSKGICHATLCPLCNLVIGTEENVSLYNQNYHANCIRKKFCYVCGNKCRINDSLEIDSEGFRHYLCNPAKCSICNEHIRIQSTQWKGQNIHTYCVPTCFACGKKDPNGLNSLEEGRYKHDDCITTPCLHCFKPLGRKREVSTLYSHKFHHSCVNRCSCGGAVMNPNLFPKVPLRFDKDLRLSYRMKDKFLALILANKKNKQLHHDVLGIIMNIMLNSDKETVTSVPIRYGVNFLETCTPHRCCSERKCATCGGEMRFYDEDTIRCDTDHCLLIKKLLRNVSVKCFGKNLKNIAIVSDYRLVRRLVKMFAKSYPKMSIEQTAFYGANIASVNILMMKKN